MTKGPGYISHVGIRARNYEAMLRWYEQVMGAEIRHQNDFLAFMTFDEEHHRMVIFTVPDTVERPPTANGIDHIGYGVRDHGHLVEIYERLRDMGIKPSSQLNHRFTTSRLSSAWTICRPNRNAPISSQARRWPRSAYRHSATTSTPKN
jgi:catechol 2,3-dioxygenase-like lactoylglutathione lyase family enzyme